jgi:hypothetical protein
MGVALDDRQVAMGLTAFEQAGHCRQKVFAEVAPFGRQVVAKAAGECPVGAFQALPVVIDGAGIEPGPDRCAEAGIVPP